VGDSGGGPCRLRKLGGRGEDMAKRRAWWGRWRRGGGGGGGVGGGGSGSGVNDGGGRPGSASCGLAFGVRRR
jgi:hypothetical protein